MADGCGLLAFAAATAAANSNAPPPVAAQLLAAKFLLLYAACYLHLLYAHYVQGQGSTKADGKICPCLSQGGPSFPETIF